MANLFSELWSWDGKVSRRKYAAAGFIGVAIKYNLDRLIAAAFFGHPNSFFFNYWAPLGKAARLDNIEGQAQAGAQADDATDILRNIRLI